MRRKMLSAILCVLLLLLLIPSTIGSAGDNSIVRVKLSLDAPTSVQVFLDGNYSISGKPLECQMYTVKLESGVLNLYLGSNVVASGASIYIAHNADSANLSNYMWMRNPHYGNDYLRYLGDMCFSITDGYIQAVNYVYLEYYLYGVVPFEMSDSFPSEALKAQAVAARNYAIKAMGGSGSYDLTDDSSQDQVYRGYYPSKTNAIAAVNATAGQVMKSGGSVISAYYSASNGGWTDLPYHRWGGGGDWTYYQIVKDDYDLANPSSLNETMKFPAAIDGAHPITAYGTGTPNISKAVAYIKQAILDSGQLAGVSSTAAFELTGITSLTAQTYDKTIKSDGSIGPQDHSRMPLSGVNNCVDMVEAVGNFTVSVGGSPAAVTGITLKLDYLSGALDSTNNMYVAFGSVLGIFVVEPYTDPDGSTGFIISQRRYGHGCGLSQRGAEQRARSGDPNVNTYDKILGFYYPGVTLDTISETKPAPAANPSVSRYNAIVTESVNVRSGPGTSYSILTGSELPTGMRVVVTVPYYTADWHQINYGGTVAYVHKDYLQLDNVMFSGTYGIDRTNNVVTVPEPTDAAQLVAGVKALGGTVAVFDQSGNAYPSGAVASDMTLRLTAGGAVTDQLRIIVSVIQPPAPPSSIKHGDANNDGTIDILDYTAVRLHILGLSPFSGACLANADANKDGTVDILDYTAIRLDILGLQSISN